MDSGNSGSMQSSSGGEEEYDSRAESISRFFNLSGNYGSTPNPNPNPQPLPLHQSHAPTTLFDHPPPPHNLDTFSQSPANPLYNNLDLAWSRNLRSETNYNMDFGNLTTGQSLMGAQGLTSHGLISNSSSMQFQSVDEKSARVSQYSDQTNVAKNPKKRSRASRRAPTTVLTTDTSNFRQMVQEFTGIPTAPFSASPYSRRLDLFNNSSLGPLYPLRPSAQKVQLSPYNISSSSSSPLLNSSMIDAITSSNTITTSIAALSNTMSSNNYQQPSDIGFSKQPMNMQNQILTFQSLLQSHSLAPPVKHPLIANAPIFGTRSQGNSSLHSFDELGVSHENVNVNLGSYKLHSSGSTASEQFNAEKGLENVSSRGEGTVDSWIFPSD